MAHIDFHVVLDVLQAHHDGCPLCRFLGTAEGQYYQSLLYSWVGTEGFQDRFLAANGFCRTHARRLGECGDGVAVSMLYAPLLVHRRRWLSLRGRRNLFRRRRSPADQGRHAGTDACLLCKQRRQWEESFLGNLVRHGSVQTPEGQALQQAYTAGWGLCFPHYRQLRSAHPTVPHWLQQFQDTRMDDIAGEVESYLAALQEGRRVESGAPWKELLRFMEGTDQG